jgi:hypothetical protein
MATIQVEPDFSAVTVDARVPVVALATVGSRTRKDASDGPSA